MKLILVSSVSSPGSLDLFPEQRKLSPNICTDPAMPQSISTMVSLALTKNEIFHQEFLQEMWTNS